MLHLHKEMAGTALASVVSLYMFLICLANRHRLRVIPEGVHVDILCNLDIRRFHLLYWRIEGRIYELYSVPAVFRVSGGKDLSIRVDRRMDGWSLQCFAINSEGGLFPDEITVLDILSGRFL